MGSENGLDSIYNREAIHHISKKKADQKIELYLDLLNKSIEDKNTVHSTTFDQKATIYRLVPEIVSRLCSKCSYKSKQSIIELLIKAYSSENIQKFTKTQEITRRLIESLSNSEQYNMLSELLKIPCPKNSSALVKLSLHSPFEYITINNKTVRKSVEIHTDSVTKLLDNSKSKDAFQRKWAVTSLITLYNLSLLNEFQTNEMIKSLWSLTNNHKLPSETNYYEFAFLKFPSPVNENPIELFKKYITNTKFPIHNGSNNKGLKLTHGDIPVVHNIIGSLNMNENIWNEDEVIHILNNSIQWWDSDKNMLDIIENGSGPFPSTAQEFRSRFYRVIGLLAEFIGPQLPYELDVKIKSEISRLLEEMNNNGLSTMEAEVRLIHLFPDQNDRLIESIKLSLTSDKHETVVRGLRAISNIIFNTPHSIYTENPLKPQALRLLSQFIMWTSNKPVISALNIITRILRNKPDIFESELRCAAVNRLDKLFIQTDLNLEESDLIFDDRLEMRAKGSMTAAELYKYYKSQHSEIPNIITKWKENCSSPDEFSELRNPWMNIQFCNESS